MKYPYLFLLVLLGSSLAHGQHHSVDHHDDDHRGFRVAALIGHTLVPTESADAHVFVPSWGLDVEYWFSSRLGVGLHNDIEIESFIFLDEEGEEIERINPLVITLDALYRTRSGVVLLAGPGIELERENNFALFRLGVEYEIPIGGHFDLAPSIFYDQRLGDGYHTWNFALGVGKTF
ncbi:hypothetical protein [Lewinella sp. W8]|uniref:hypothetical protein n=1 Tax=Lewinella sp. W8 TaxID=2528208 RepID=UPI001067907B|nr:hypothetical protein [Lewinella sp. W8]MTB50337.1 hypothetical protein [Lewinella sp. W8]